MHVDEMRLVHASFGAATLSIGGLANALTERNQGAGSETVAKFRCARQSIAARARPRVYRHMLRYPRETAHGRYGFAIARSSDTGASDMNDRIQSSTSISPIEQPDSQPAQNPAAAPNRRAPRRTLDAGLPRGAGSASGLAKRTDSAPPSPLLRRTLSRSDLTDRVAAFSQRFQEGQESPSLGRRASTRELDVVERPRTQLARATHSERETSEAYPPPGTRPHPAASSGPYPPPDTRPHWHAPQPHYWRPPVAATYHAPYHWSAQHTYHASGQAISPHGYTSYRRPLPWHAPLPRWQAPYYHSRIVGAHSRFGFSYGFGEGHGGSQMHVGFHFNGRFHTLRFGLFPNATRPFFVEADRGYLHTPPAPAWSPPPRAHGTSYASAFYATAAINQNASTTVASRPWRATLGIREQDATLETVTRRYDARKQYMAQHPSADNPAKLAELEAAYHEALQALSVDSADEHAEAAGHA